MTLPDDLRDRQLQILEIVRERGYRHREEPFQLASGEWSHDFIDGKRALAHGRDLRLACQLIIDWLAAQDIAFDAVGGLTMGADQFSHGIALLAETTWFVVRKERKGRGTDQLVEAGPIGPGSRVLLVDDVVTTGGSILKAYDEVARTEATIVAAATLVDRGDQATVDMAARGVPYFPVISYVDLGIPRVGAALVP